VSMFYGVDGSRSKSVSANERIRYAPFSGARFGGSLLFSYLGKTYRIERFFGKTPSADSVKIYDENNMQCYAFGEKAERLGETLFGMDRTSFEKCVYLPQGGGAEGLTGDIKSKLVSLLSLNDGANGAPSAVERLENAERALRAKRKPAKGKLDELDEKLAYLSAREVESLRADEEAKKLFAEAESVLSRINALKENLQTVTQKLDEYASKTARVAVATAYTQIRAQKEEAEKRLGVLQEFFKQTDARTVNLTGIKTAIDEYYAIEAEIDNLKQNAQSFSANLARRENLQTRISLNEQTLLSYRQMSEQAQEKPVKVKSGNRKTAKRGNFFLTLAFAVALFGATQIQLRPVLGIALVLVGAIGIILSGVLLFKNAGSGKKRSAVDKTLQENYEKLLAETQSLQAELAELLSQTEDGNALDAKTQERQNRLTALENAIKGFFAHFAFGEIYDYRSAYQTLAERIDEYARLSQTVETCDGKLIGYGDVETGGLSQELTSVQAETLKAEQAETRSAIERLTAQRARIYAEAENYQKTAGRLYDLRAETERLTLEKNRLEKRLVAIRTAKELLLRARANMATRYLQPVETKVREYAKHIGFSLGEVKFSAEGKPLVEEGGSLRETEYYSAGLQDVLWFCVRLALAETLFTKDAPPLLLDDPFVNLDDEKTAKAKALVKTLSSKYQIVYFTCKAQLGL